MSVDGHILLFGATGMLGRPVARRLVEAGFRCRAMVRDVERAKALLPDSVELIKGDLRDVDSIRRSAEGAHAVYINLAVPMRKRPPEFDPELDGTRSIVEVAREIGSIEHILRISAMGVDEAAGRWWPARHKRDADQHVIDSGVPYTIFRPTWFMESLATLELGRLMLSFSLGGVKLRWIAGDDLARQVVAAIQGTTARNRIYHPQGPEWIPIPEAIKRYARARIRRPIVLPFPALFMFSVAGFVSGKANYMAHLLTMTRHEFARYDQTLIETDIPNAMMTVEDYVAYMERTGDKPSK